MRTEPEARPWPKRLPDARLVPGTPAQDSKRMYQPSSSPLFLLIVTCREIRWWDEKRSDGMRWDEMALDGMGRHAIRYGMG